MLKNLFTSNKTNIGSSSHGNLVIQESSIDNIIVCNGTTEIIKTMGKMQQYDAIQKIISDCMNAAKQTHPLSPYFTAKYNSELNKLVSTPETVDAFKIFPKRIKGDFCIDYSKYPHIDRSETPWEYAYRTQTEVEMETTAYQEYLGDIPDPFPNAEYQEGMVTVIGYNEFPPATEAHIVSGDVSIPILLRRKPCMEFEKIVFGTIQNRCAFDLDIILHKNEPKIDFKITNIQNCDLNERLQREKLYCEFLQNKNMSVMIGENSILEYTFSDTELNNGIFLNAPVLARYIECLLIIEKHTQCKFDIFNKDFSEDDYQTALILAASFENKWHREILTFDDILCDYNKIPDGIENFEQLSLNANSLKVSLQGHIFFVDTLTVLYQYAKINNIDSVLKNKKNRKKQILLTFRPIENKNEFFKYYKFKNIQLQSENGVI